MSFETIEEANKAYEALKAESAQDKTSVEALENKVNQLLGEKKSAAQKAREAEEAAAALKLEADKKNGDFESIQKSFDEKLKGIEVQYGDKFSMFESKFKNQTVNALKAELFAEEAQDIGALAIERRIKIDTSGDDVKTIVLDANGQPSAMTVDELKQEISGSKQFARILKGSQASGVGGFGDNGGGAAGKTITRSDFDSMNQYERAEFFKNSGKIAED